MHSFQANKYGWYLDSLVSFGLHMLGRRQLLPQSHGIHIHSTVSQNISQSNTTPLGS